MSIVADPGVSRPLMAPREQAEDMDDWRECPRLLIVEIVMVVEDTICNSQMSC